ncbi:hypothetical protein DMB42_09135 [Nonomuraea sp. WAC 01424]|uniref:TetR/AcrR family transcriptional regulator n=1 Tax=Nonomuraea sp. WAC 01424 TaxID=2203200 RepID=UPI000F7AD455|nr:TetR/AcrR family transcriptional regulator [Nonomuraea sp. WAC 01424]RSN14633.1 hypothetical protein DMB42_09135 [Nonomuraea sp. WAC 01424]
MTEAAQAKREQIVAAALGVFGRYGYRRTSMDLIAQAARMSRPALYLVFKGKEDVFRAVGRRLVHDALAAAESARRSGASPADRLYGVLAVKIDLFGGTVEGGFRSELLADAAVVAEDVRAAFEEGFRDVVERTLNDCARELALLGVALPPRDAADLLVAATEGIAGAKAEPAVLRTRLRQLVELVVRGLSGSA